MAENKEEKLCWTTLKRLHEWVRPKRIEYEIEHKDGLPNKLKNIKIEEIDLTRPL